MWLQKKILKNVNQDSISTIVNVLVVNLFLLVIPKMPHNVFSAIKIVKIVIHRVVTVKSVGQGVNHLRKIAFLVPLRPFQMANLLVNLALKAAVNAIAVLEIVLNVVKVMD